MQVYKDPSNVDDYLISSITAPTADPNAGEVYYRCGDDLNIVACSDSLFHIPKLKLLI